jgi:hypothetical protein
MMCKLIIPDEESVISVTVKKQIQFSETANHTIFTLIYLAVLSHNADKASNKNIISTIQSETQKVVESQMLV